jgi:hypothetical protein
LDKEIIKTLNMSKIIIPELPVATIQIDSKFVMQNPNNMVLGEKIRFLIQSELDKIQKHEQISKNNRD